MLATNLTRSGCGTPSRDYLCTHPTVAEDQILTVKSLALVVYGARFLVC